jgi:hypothetical protein
VTYDLLLQYIFLLVFISLPISLFNHRFLSLSHKTSDTLPCVAVFTTKHDVDLCLHRRGGCASCGCRQGEIGLAGLPAMANCVLIHCSPAMEKIWRERDCQEGNGLGH